MVERVLATDAAIELIERLTRTHGKLMFHQSGGCCDGSSPMCYPAGEFRIGGNDTYLGEIGGCPVYMDLRPVRLLEAHPAHHRRGAWARAAASRSRRPRACAS